MIRLYQSRDRAAIRQICCDTADKGEPVERFFQDREIFADLLTRYYTDFEPQETWVVESNGQVRGYLTGCLDTRRYRQRMAWKIIPAAVIRALGRGTFLHPQTWRVLGAGVRTFWMGGFQPHTWLDDYPAHLHINILKELRGRELGQRLMEKFIEDARGKKLKGIHLVTRGDNTPAQRFFERLGFKALARRQTSRLDHADHLPQESIIYGKKL